MFLPLHHHPDTPCRAVDRVEVEIATREDRLHLVYRVGGHVSDLVVAQPDAPLRTDGLWRSTCFEAFLKPMPGEGYVEYNFATSGRWAAYVFDRYRDAGRRPLDTSPPVIGMRSGAGMLVLDVELALPDQIQGCAWRLGLTAVIEEASGGKSYWALAHPPGKPDFHRSEGFVLEFP